MMRVTIWNEGLHERSNPRVGKIYPDGMHAAMADGLAALSAEGELAISAALLSDPEQGLSEDRLAATDVLLWWGHRAHDDVLDRHVDRVQRRVLEGMGLIVLHSGHHAKIFRRLMGTSCSLRWREVGERERLWVVQPGHPIVAGIDTCIELEHAEMYGEPFVVPEPDETVFISWFEGGEVFRSGCCWRRGRGKIFYFRPGHETYPIFYQPEIRRVLYNAVKWARPDGNWPDVMAAPNRPLDQTREPISDRSGLDPANA